MRHTIRPLTDTLWVRGNRKLSRFTATWTDTCDLLYREVDMLGGKEVIIGLDVREGQVRLDGGLYSNAKVNSPAVEVAFESRHGPLLYRCDRWTVGYGAKMREHWQHNVRAIVLTLEALRAVDRHGASGSGAQYTGFKAIGTGPATEAMTVEVAKRTLMEYANTTGEPGSDDDWAVVVRRARAATHPDRNGGARTAWNLVEACTTMLRGAGYLR